MPLLGPALKLAEGAPWDTMTRWAKEYGIIYKFSLFGHANVVLSDPALIKEVMRTKVRMAPEMIGGGDDFGLNAGRVAVAGVARVMLTGRLISAQFFLPCTCRKRYGVSSLPRPARQPSQSKDSCARRPFLDLIPWVHGRPNGG